VSSISLHLRLCQRNIHGSFPGANRKIFKFAEFCAQSLYLLSQSNNFIFRRLHRRNTDLLNNHVCIMPIRRHQQSDKKACSETRGRKGAPASRADSMKVLSLERAQDHVCACYVAGGAAVRSGPLALQVYQG
jgi:hypothetical protein